MRRRRQFVVFCINRSVHPRVFDGGDHGGSRKRVDARIQGYAKFRREFRPLAEAILERDNRRKSEARQAAEKVRRQKRRRSRRQKQKMLADKRAHSEIKAVRRMRFDEE